MLATNLCLAFVGGGLGSLARWGVGLAVGERFRGPFPLGTFLINVTGAFLIGFLTVLFQFDWRDRFGHSLNTIVLTGVLGGYTTFSSMQLDAATLLKSRRGALALVYLVGSILAGLAASACGGGVAGQLGGRG